MCASRSNPRTRAAAASICRQPTILAAGAALLTAAPAFAQCQPTWSTLPHTGQATAFATYDEDGSGPSPPMFFVGGVTEIGVNRGVNSPTAAVSLIARGDPWAFYSADEGFEPWPPEALIGSPESVRPSLRGVFAGGQFSRSGPTPIRRVARWTGTRWEEVGGGAESYPRAFAFLMRAMALCSWPRISTDCREARRNCLACHDGMARGGRSSVKVCGVAIHVVQE